jgi:Ca2+-binding EF-hand superfamily protein
MDEFELREAVIERFDVYDLVETLDLTTEDLVDVLGVLDYDKYRKIIIERL